MSIGKGSSLQGKLTWRQTRSLAFPVSGSHKHRTNFQEAAPESLSMPIIWHYTEGGLCRQHRVWALTSPCLGVSLLSGIGSYSLQLQFTLFNIYHIHSNLKSLSLLWPRGAAAKICFWNDTTSSWTWSESKRAWRRDQTFGLVPVYEERQTALDSWWNPNFPQSHITSMLHLRRTALVSQWL